MTALQRQYFGRRRRSAPRAPAAIVVRTSTGITRRRRYHRARSAARGFLAGSGTLTTHFIGGAAFGFAVKQGWIDHLPEVPIIGRTGLAALLLAEASKRGLMSTITGPASKAAATLAGYQFGDTGAIHGQLYPSYEPG